MARNRNEVAHNMTNRRPERQVLEKLLPWHAARTLSRREADLVERALTADAELARCYDLVRQELADTIHLKRNARCAVGTRHGKAVRRN